MLHPRHQPLFDLLRPHLPLDPRKLHVFTALILNMIQARTVVLYQLVPHLQLSGTTDSRYKRLKRFVQSDLSDLLVARLVLRYLNPGKIYLVIDRTHWQLGQHHVNVLLISAVWNSFAFPLCWTVLDHAGNSSQQHRIQLLKRLLPLLDNFTIGGLLADREFIGQEWFQFLAAQKIPPFIRLKADTRVNGQPVWSCFKKMAPLEVRYWHRPMKLYGVRFRVMATKSHKGEMLYLAYSGRGDQALKWYAKRWNAENLHAALKSRGFKLEESGLYQPKRVAVLLTCVTLAFVWCCLTGEWAERQKPSQPLKHGYPAKSLFRRGLDLLQEDFLQRSRMPDPGGLPIFEVLH